MVKAKEHPEWEVLGILQNLRAKTDAPGSSEESFEDGKESSVIDSSKKAEVEANFSMPC